MPTETEAPAVSAALVITPDGLDAIISTLKARGYTVLGPRLEHGAIVHGEIGGTGDLPRGRRDVQSPGAYRVEERSGPGSFAFSAGAISWKSILYPAVLTLWTARRDGNGMSIDGVVTQPRPLAVIGVRPCDAAAIEILDRVLLDRAIADEDYRRRRKDLFIIGVNCSDPVSTCFCASMGTGPRMSSGYDLALTELVDGDRCRYLVEIGSDRGAELVAVVPSQAAARADRDAAREITAKASVQMGSTLDRAGLPEWLADNADHPHWQTAAQRCLTCGNCTLVCPTCFCTTVRDTMNVTGTRAERQRLWDSCFTSDFSYIHGGSIRASAGSRLRHRVTHKLGTWQSQFGTSGCVGCGRCTTWCPAGIDMTAEIRTMRDRAAAPEVEHADA